MSESNADPFPFLTLDLDIGPTPFFDINELQAWTNKERENFQWLFEVYKAENAAGQGWNQLNNFHSTIDSFVREFLNHPSNEAHRHSLIIDLKSRVKAYIREHKVGSSASSAAQFVLGLRSFHPDNVAGYALNILMGQGFTPNTANAWEGAFLALQYKKGSPETVDAEKKALDALKKVWASRFETHHTAIIERGVELNTEIAEHKETFALLKNKLDAFHGLEEEKFQNLYTKIREQLSDIERTYNDKMALHSSVRYWDTKRKNHGSAMKWLGGFTLLSVVATTVLFLWAVSGLSIATVAEVPISQISVLLAISTVGIWLTRLCTKIFISNLHLKTDADERVTMILTYLALLRKGNGPPENERQLILQTLFRPSAAGLVKDDGPAGFFELLKLAKKE